MHSQKYGQAANGDSGIKVINKKKTWGKVPCFPANTAKKNTEGSNDEKTSAILSCMRVCIQYRTFSRQDQ